jgi:hypothetical protein
MNYLDVHYESIIVKNVCGNYNYRVFLSIQVSTYEYTKPVNCGVKKKCFIEVINKYLQNFNPY